MSTEHPTEHPTAQTAAQSTDVRRSGRHPVDIGHLVMGVAFTGLLVVWALVVSGVVDGDGVRFLLPVPWVVAGAAGLVGLVAADRRRAGARQTGWTPAAGSGPPPTMEA